GALVFVNRYGCNVPFWDEWQIVPFLAGNHYPTLGYLWEQYNEHRIFLPKLLLWGLSKLTHCDSRAGMFFNAIALGSLAFVTIRVVRTLRGKLHYTDAFFPLALLHLGHWENLLWNFQVQFVLSTLLAGLFLLTIARSQNPLTF